jgi:hypothetical protein
MTCLSDRYVIVHPPMHGLLCFTISVRTLDKSWALSMLLSWFWKKVYANHVWCCAASVHAHVPKQQWSGQNMGMHTYRFMRFCMYSHLIYHRLGWLLFIYACNYQITLKNEFEYTIRSMWSIWQKFGEIVPKYVIDMIKCDWCCILWNWTI